MMQEKPKKEESQPKEGLSEAERLQKSFKQMDADEDGNIDTKDLHTLVNFWAKHILGTNSKATKAREKLLGSNAHSYTGAPESVVQEFISDMDADGDGKVEYADYVAFATKLATSPQ